MNDVPVLKDELRRKTFDALVKVLLDYEEGRIPEAMLSYGVDLIWTVSSGLVNDREFLDIVGEVRTARFTKPIERRVLWGHQTDGKFVVLIFDRMPNAKMILRRLDDSGVVSSPFRPQSLTFEETIRPYLSKMKEVDSATFKEQAA